jgi:two-component system, chemotaxis family, chemotaxis protein CheY
MVAKRVILVDDSKTVIATAQMALEELVANGTLEFRSFLDPTDFLAQSRSGDAEFDLLISDVNMPQMNGLDLVAFVKENPALRTKPVLILTTESSAEMKQRGKDLGVTGWMVKPFSDDKLVKSIKMVLGI